MTVLSEHCLTLSAMDHGFVRVGLLGSADHPQTSPQRIRKSVAREPQTERKPHWYSRSGIKPILPCSNPTYLYIFHPPNPQQQQQPIHTPLSRAGLVTIHQTHPHSLHHHASRTLHPPHHRHHDHRGPFPRHQVHPSRPPCSAGTSLRMSLLPCDQTFALLFPQPVVRICSLHDVYRTVASPAARQATPRAVRMVAVSVIVGRARAARIARRVARMGAARSVGLLSYERDS